MLGGAPHDVLELCTWPGHKFDEGCIKKHRATKGRNAKCPKGCPERISATIPDPVFKQHIREEVKARCPSEGCDQTLTLDALPGHLKETCNYARCAV